uniref:Ig-like domain-containing protein n=1 Tax=Shewanella marina TaxID=487319 RepID=UPI000472EEEB
MKVIQVNYSFSIQSINGNAFVLSDDGRLQQLKQGELITKGQLLIVNEHSKLTYLLGDKLYSIVSSDASVINEQELNNPNVVKLLSEYPSINIDNDNGIFQLTHNDLNIEPIVLKHDNTSITNDFNHVFDQVIANAGHDTEYQPEIWKTVYHQFVGSDDEPYQEVNPNSFKINAVITINNITSDDVINAVEAKTDIAVHGLVGADVKVGDIVTVTIDNHQYKTHVEQGLIWSVNVAGHILVDNPSLSVHASVTTSNQYGHSITADADHAYKVDTDINAAITITNIADDDVINATEAKGKVAVSGMVGADVKAGDIVHLTVDGKVLGTAIVNADLTWTAQVDGATLESATKDSVHASVTTTDKAGNAATAETDHIYSIDTDINAAITITKIAEDDVINATEAKGQVAVSGTVGADVKAGDIVHLTVDGNYLGKATVKSDLTWSTLVDGSTLENAAKDSVHASVTATDKAGNSATAETNHTYSIDTDINAAITITNIAEDDVINAAEAKGQVAVSGTVGKDVKVGDIVHLTVDDNYLGKATVNSDLTWSTLVDGATLVSAKNDNIHASVTASDSAGNTAYAETDHNYIYALISITKISNNYVVNAAKPDEYALIGGTVGGSVKVGDEVKLSINGIPLCTTYVEEKNGELVWNKEVLASELVNVTICDIDASVSTTGEHDNVAIANANHPYIYATISITEIADDDVINSVEAKEQVAVSGSVGGDVKAGDVIHLSVDGKDLGTAIVKSDHTWTAQVDGETLSNASKESIHATVSTQGSSNNIATAETDHIYSIDTDINAAITIINIADDDVINAAEAKDKVTVSGMVDKDVKAGDIVHLTVDGKVLGTATVKADLTWTAQVDGATLASASKDSVHASVTTTDKAGNSATAETDHIYSIDTKIDAEITITKIAEDDVINATEAKGQVAVSGTVGADVKAGDIVHLTVDGKVLGTATVKADLTWTAQVDGATLESATKDSVHASVTTTDKAGNSATAETDHIYSIDTKIDAEITITKIAEDDVINATEAKGQVAISGTVDKDVKAGDIVHLTVDGKVLGTATVKADLTWSTLVDGATLAGASRDSVHASVTTTDKAGNAATAETDHIYSIDTEIAAAITITNIADDDVIN